jgi:hypothetical protein
MSWAHPADLRVRDKQGMGVSEAAENTADTCASKLLKGDQEPEAALIDTRFGHHKVTHRLKNRIRGG